MDVITFLFYFKQIEIKVVFHSEDCDTRYLLALYQMLCPEAKDKSWEKKLIVLEEGLEATQGKWEGGKGESESRGNCETYV